MEGSAAHQRTWERRLRKYEQTYMEVIRAGVARYAAISEIFPEEFRQPVRTVAVYCKDGIVVARYQSNADEFQFDSSPRETIFDVGHRLRAGDLRAKVADLLPAPKWITEIRNMRIEFRPVGSSDVIHIRPDWFSLTPSKGFVAAFWTPDQARIRAMYDVITFVAGRSLGIDRSELLGSPADTAQRTYAVYEDVVQAFRDLVNTATQEASLQAFLRDHPILLALDAAKVHPKLKLGDDYVTDFVLDMGNAEYILVEIEAATHPLYTGQGNPSAALTHAIQQVEDWLSWIPSALWYIRAKLPGIVEPECWVVIGRRPTNDGHRAKWERKKRSTHRIRLFTYDDLLDKADRQLTNLRRYR